MTPEEREKFMYERGQRDMQKRCAEVARAHGHLGRIPPDPLRDGAFADGYREGQNTCIAAIESLDMET